MRPQYAEGEIAPPGPTSTKELEALWDRNRKSTAQRLAAERVPSAIKTLDQVMKRKGRKASDSAKVSAAREILHQAEGKPAQRVIHDMAGGPGGMTVCLIHFGSDHREVIDVTPPEPPLEAQSERQVNDDPL